MASRHRGGGVDLVARHDAARLRALLSQDARELAGVDAADGHHLVARQEVAQVFGFAPVARQRRDVSNYQAGRVGRGRLEVFRRGAGVADVWIGQRDDLS